MKSFKQFIEFLTEDRLYFLKKKYKDLKAHELLHINYDTDYASKIDDIISWFYTADPTPNKKYLDWILRQYSRKDFRQEDIIRVENALIGFERYKAHLAQKDINHYHHLADLEDAIETVAGTKSKREEIKDVKHDGADKIFDRGGVTVYKIKTEAAAKFYGANTRWCTAAEHNCQFNNYNKKGPLYVVFCKDLEGKPTKYQFHFETDQFMDVRDNNINLEKLIKKNPALKEVPGWQGKKTALTKDFNKYFDKLLLSDPENTIKDSRFTQEHISKMLNDSNLDVRWQAIRHPKATPENITKALNDSNLDVRIHAIDHPNVTLEHITKALNDSNLDVRVAAIEHPKATPENITKALDDSEPYVRRLAIRHPNATSEQISKALNDSDSGVRWRAIEHPNVTPEHITKALNDKDSDVRRVAIKHPNATPEHIAKALNDPDSWVRDVARRYSNYI